MLSDGQKKLLTKALSKKAREGLSAETAKSLASDAGLCQRFIEIFALEKGIIPLRFSRNIGSLYLDGQKKLLESSCLVVGLGGLGGFVAEGLARAGVGKIYAADDDVFDQTNLNRQLFAAENNIGKLKSKEAQKRIKRVNGSVEFRAYHCKFSELPEKVWNGVRLVFDCLDNIQDRLALADKCSRYGIPLIHGAIAGWCGEVAVLWPKSRLLEQVYKTDKTGLEKRLGTPVFTAAVAAGLMTAEGIKLLIDKTFSKETRIFYFDLMQNIWQTVNL